MGNRDSLGIDRIALIGRTFDEYIKMFGLNDSVLEKGPTLDCPAGPSSFTAEAHRAGFDVTACDILFDLFPDMLVSKGRKDITHVFERFDEVSHLYVWNYYRDKGEVIALRRKALSILGDDFAEGLEQGRYRKAELPDLPFADGTFSFVLSSHFLFLYGDRLDPSFHLACVREFLRVCSGEVRIFPLVGLDARSYPYMDDLLAFLPSEEVVAETLEVPFEFERGASKMMRLSRYPRNHRFLYRNRTQKNAVNKKGGYYEEGLFL